MATYPDEIKDAAARLYLQRYTPAEIAKKLNLNSVRVIYTWVKKGNWGSLLTEESVEDCITRRINVLVKRDNKTSLELDEIDRLIEHHVKLLVQRSKHAEKMAAIGHGAGGNGGAPGGVGFMAAGEDEKPAKLGKRVKNDVSLMPAEKFAEFAENSLFEYQKICRANLHLAIRNILKSRQVGMTWYFAFEALENACLTGDNQIFVSASKRQSEIFRRYIVKFAQELFGVTLTGTPIVLSNGASLIFLSTNKNTAQGETGHLYCDEYFWVPKFQLFKDVAGAMATHDKFRRTYFSTPSAKTHDAYPFWTGKEWAGKDKKRLAEKFPDFDEMRDGGRMCPDGQWRYVITLADACAGGLSKYVTFQRIKDEHSPDAFNLLYMCVFIDSGDSVFRFDMLVRCEVDPATWQDFKASDRRPFGEREVWGGFDPARTGDTSTFVVVAPPTLEGERFRVLETYRWNGMNFKYQADQIIKIMAKYRMTYVGVDVTGIGRGVFERLQIAAPREVRDIHYSTETKNNLVMKMIDTVEADRIEWDAENKSIAASFLAIRRTSTASGNALTFVAERSAETGHADEFFAISHAVIHEPLNFDTQRKSTWFFERAA
ncbi:terminase large subunit domain-containing protein [Acerihabitans arboris]|uniref:Terminase n=1 Tax=Acerihabitans arboris TaxID=2691583 RepID=A0A845SI48_9GAMM|nr:terminase family protein [Acerihabitans arboris]NDL64823.1 terminase [Acerihabitans arboris]